MVACLHEPCPDTRLLEYEWHEESHPTTWGAGTWRTRRPPTVSLSAEPTTPNTSSRPAWLVEAERYAAEKSKSGGSDPSGDSHPRAHAATAARQPRDVFRRLGEADWRKEEGDIPGAFGRVLRPPERLPPLHSREILGGGAGPAGLGAPFSLQPQD